MTQQKSFPKLDAMEAAARAKGRLTVAVAYPCSQDSLAAALAAHRDGFTIHFTGPVDRAAAAKKANYVIERYRRESTPPRIPNTESRNPNNDQAR